MTRVELQQISETAWFVQWWEDGLRYATDIITVPGETPTHEDLARLLIQGELRRQ